MPAESFDPTVDAVLRFAGQLGRVQRRGRSFLERPASAVRVGLQSRPGGQMAYGLQAPARARPILRAALGEYPGVDLRAAPSPDADDGHTAAGRPDGRVFAARAELVLARPAYEPLAELGLDPDPLAAFASVFADLAEQAEIAIDLLPCPAWRARLVRRRLTRQARRHDSGLDAGRTPAAAAPRPAASDRWLRTNDLFGARGGDRPAPVDLAHRHARVADMTGKLAGRQPLLAVQVLLRVRSRSKGRAKQQLQALLSGFDTFAAANHWRAVGLPVFDVAFVGPDSRLRRRAFDRRMDTGRFAPPRRNLLVAWEIAGLLKPPTRRCGAHNVIRSAGAVAPPPSGLPAFDRQPGLLPLGKVHDHRGERIVGVPLADTFFEYVSGRSRFGKTELGLVQFVHLARSGHGAFFLDPHADAIEHAKAFLTEQGVADRVIEINLAGRGARDRQTGWNPLAMAGLAAEHAEAKVEAFVDALASALGWTERNTRALTVATQAARALVELSQRLPAEHAPTIFEIPTLLSNDQWRARLLPYLSVPTRQFFCDRFSRLSTEAITPVTNLVDRLRASTPIAALLGSSRSTYDIRVAMDQGMIVLACPGAGGTVDQVVANLLVYDLLHAAKTRAAQAPAERRPFAVFLDEIQIYDGAGTGNLAALLEQTAKYGLRGYLFNQNPDRLSAATLNALTTNRSHLLTTALNAHAAGLLTREWGGDPSPETVTKLARYTYLASVTLHGATSPPFVLHGVTARELYPDAHCPDAVDRLEQVIDETTRRAPVAETIAALDTLPDRILEHLHPPQGGGDRARGGVDIDVSRGRA